MFIADIKSSGWRSEVRDVVTEKGIMRIEALIPDKTDEKALKRAEKELCKIFSKYCEVSDSCKNQ
ncbi:hypothetical protein [Ruminococcus flavefaciens]|uniref:hypothetical protein n=1 Tax=Ruminococcus flavefaciens TaxID=1265 RepID=UPI0002EE5AA8|nr:hypothetical protein [Ruminococcus flavefaciens]